MLSLEDYRNYKQNRGKSSVYSRIFHPPLPSLTSRLASYTENDCSLFRSKICELHPVHRASLGALLLHLLCLSSHSDTNLMTVEALATQFCYAVLRGGAVVQDGVHVKARPIDLL